MSNTENKITNDNENRKIERDARYWRSFDELNNTPEFQTALQTEFMSSPLREESIDEGTEKDGVARRDFLKLMGASIALTSAAGCIRRPVQKIVPYNKQPEEVTVGMSNWYTSSYFDGQEGLGLLVKSREGRPIHIQGNPKFPLNGQGVSVKAQASLLGLYEPHRLQKPFRNLLNEARTNKETVQISWEDLDNKVVEALKKGQVALLTGNISSPSTKAVISDFKAGFGADQYVWEPLADNVSSGQAESFGEALLPGYRFDKAQVIVSVDGDFLGTWGSTMTNNKRFADGRRNVEKMSRLYSFDSTYSLTGANADIRYKIKPSQQFDVVMGLIAEVANKVSVADAVKTLVAPFKDVSQSLGIDPEAFKKVAMDLVNNQGESLVVAGGIQTNTKDGLALQIAINYLNSILGNEGKTVVAQSGNKNITASNENIKSLIKKMKDGAVKTLIIYRLNPFYSLSSDLGFVEAIKKVETVIFVGDKMDETAVNAHYVASDNHALETWNDSEFSNGLYGIHQPLIRTMYDTRSFQLSLMTWAYLAKVGPKRIQEFETYYDYLRNFWKTEMKSAVGGKDFDSFWDEFLQNGYVGDIATGSARSFKGNFSSLKKSLKSDAKFELALYPTVNIGDGTLANIGWLQELPDPVTKIVWDNYACVSVKTAAENNLREGDVIELTVEGKKLSLPAHIQPGLHDQVVAVAVGYGRTHAGDVAKGVGQNAFTLAQAGVFSGLPVEFKKTGKKIELVTTQGHDSMEGRQIVVTATNKDIEKNKEANIHRHHTWNIWSGHQYNGHKWGMAVDLNVCTGCSSCMTACQSENNISVVGKKYVMQGREMHWIRIDRYYTGTPENAETVFQPVMCQHCDNAPCETVCPVSAVTHSSEGLNEQVYNRCVGTRYCSNNCPYKVRRFNWFNYAKLIEKPMHMALNPEVLVRVRGVMEKCTFCVQRIKEAKNVAKTEDRKLKDGDVKVACEAACPTNAIVFGDLNDETSRVAKAFKSEPRSYALLEEWYAKPSVRYQSKIKNNDLVTPEKSHGATPDHASQVEKGADHA